MGCYVSFFVNRAVSLITMVMFLSVSVIFESNFLHLCFSSALGLTVLMGSTKSILACLPVVVYHRGEKAACWLVQDENSVNSLNSISYWMSNFIQLNP